MSLFDNFNTLDDLRFLFASRESELETLEYKTASPQLTDHDKDEAAKSISAFANSLAGLLPTAHRHQLTIHRNHRSGCCLEPGAYPKVPGTPTTASLTG